MNSRKFSSCVIWMILLIMNVCRWYVWFCVCIEHFLIKIYSIDVSIDTIDADGGLYVCITVIVKIFTINFIYYIYIMHAIHNFCLNHRLRHFCQFHKLITIFGCDFSFSFFISISIISNIVSYVVFILVINNISFLNFGFYFQKKKSK